MCAIYVSHDCSIIHLLWKVPESATPLSKGHHQASGSMKTKELSKQVKNKVVEKYRSGLGYKKYISETLNIPPNTIKSIIKNGKNMAPQQKERAAHQNSQTRQGRH